MPFAFDRETKQITMACGDTAAMEVEVQWNRLKSGDALLFAIFDRSTGADVLTKAVRLEDGRAYIRLCSHDTRDIPAGRYKWNLRIVTDPEFGSDGAVRAEDCSDEVVTVFDDPPTFRLTKGGAFV